MLFSNSGPYGVASGSMRNGAPLAFDETSRNCAYGFELEAVRPTKLGIGYVPQGRAGPSAYEQACSLFPTFKERAGTRSGGQQ